MVSSTEDHNKYHWADVSVNDGILLYLLQNLFETNLLEHENAFTYADARLCAELTPCARTTRFV